MHGKSLKCFHLIDAFKSIREVSELLLKSMFEYDGKDRESKKTGLCFPHITTLAHMVSEANNTYDLLPGMIYHVQTS